MIVGCALVSRRTELMLLGVLWDEEKEYSWVEHLKIYIHGDGILGQMTTDYMKIVINGDEDVLEYSNNAIFFCNE